MSRRNNPRLKRPFTEQSYTVEQAQELMKCARDPVYFITNYVFIKHPVRGQIKFAMYDYQQNMVRQFEKNRYNIVLASRQVGKTETSAAYLLWYALFNEEKMILILSNKSDGAKEIIAKIQNAYEELPHWLKPGIDEDSWNKHECRFDNKSRILAGATSADSARGLAISLLYLDEFAFVKTHLQEEFWTSVLPTLSTGGSCIISSTPNGNSNRFAQMWREAENDGEFVPTRVPWDAPPGRDEDFKKQQISILGKRKWLQEYECEFLSSDVTLIDNFTLTQIEKELDKLYKDNDGEPIIEMTVADVEFFKKPKKSLAYIVSVDVSTGSGKDYSVIQITEFPTMQQVGQFRSNQTSEKFLYSKLKNILLFLEQNSKEVYFSIENNGVGSSILALYEFDDRPPTQSYLISDPTGNRLGIAMSEQVKRRTALKLKSMVETQSYKIRCPKLIDEFKNYTRQGSTFKAEAGATDDIIASLLIMVRMLEEMADFNPYAYEKVYNAKGYDDKQDEWEEKFVDNPSNLDDAPMPIVF